MGPYYLGTCVFVTLLVVCQGQTEEDEKRPYKFAFAIEGYQHRSEEKDEKGIIMGEFGFVTGDGVYHVTVYATDENGDFKILSMKNFYIGLPGEGTTVAPTRAPTRPTITTPSSKSAILKHLEGLMGCGGCIVPDKNNAQPGGSVGGKPPSKYADNIDVRLGEGQRTPGHPKTPGVAVVKPAYNLKPPIGSEKQSFGSGGVLSNTPGGSEKQSFGGAGRLPNAPGSGGQSYGTQGNVPSGNLPAGGSPQYKTPSEGLGIQFLQNPKTGAGVQRPGGGGVNQPQTTGGSPFQPKFGGPSFSQGLPGTSQERGTGTGALPGGSSGKSSQPGRPQYSEGLPPGMTMDDLMALLYKFNYTLKYHGHHESGYRNGDKEGGYFFNGRDGLGRNVKYLANEFGFQPNITLVDLGLQSPDTPKEVNEEPNELKGNEFKWFYQR